MTALNAYARHGSCSYGPLAPERLRAILLGEPIVEPGDLARVEQALLETHRALAPRLAAELSLTVEALDARAVALVGLPLGATAVGAAGTASWAASGREPTA